MKTQELNDLSNKINEIIKNSPIEDTKENLRALFQGMLTKMELVSREEFDIQTEVLRRAREQLVALEKKLAELEKQAP